MTRYGHCKKLAQKCKVVNEKWTDLFSASFDIYAPGRLEGLLGADWGDDDLRWPITCLPLDTTDAFSYDNTYTYTQCGLMATFRQSILASCHPIFFLQLFWKKSLRVNGTSFYNAGCLSCYSVNSVEELKPLNPTRQNHPLASFFLDPITPVLRERNDDLPLCQPSNISDTKIIAISWHWH